MIRSYEDYVKLQKQVDEALEEAKSKILEFFKKYKLEIDITLENDEFVYINNKNHIIMSVYVKQQSVRDSFSSGIKVILGDEDGEPTTKDLFELSIEIVGSILDEIRELEDDVEYILDELAMQYKMKRDSNGYVKITNDTNHLDTIKFIIDKYKPEIEVNFLRLGMKNGMEEYLSSLEFQDYYFGKYSSNGEKIKEFRESGIPIRKEYSHLIDSEEIGLL